MSDVIRVLARLQAKPGKGEDLLTLWPAFAEQVRGEQACLSYEFFREAKDPDRFVVWERWASMEGLAAHGKMPHMAAFGAAVGDIMAGRPEMTVLGDDAI